MIYFYNLFILLNDDISNIQSSFQDGCSTIASKITSLGVNTASNASPNTISDNIQLLYDNLKPYDINNFPLYLVSNTSASSNIRLITKLYTSLIIKVISYSNCPFKIYGGQTIDISATSSESILLKSVSSNGEYTINISKYDYIYITGTPNVSGYTKLEFTFI